MKQNTKAEAAPVPVKAKSRQCQADIQEFIDDRKPAISANLVKEVLHLVQACQATEPAIPPHALARLKMDDPSQPPA